MDYKGLKVGVNGVCKRWDDWGFFLWNVLNVVYNGDMGLVWNL